MPRRAPTQIEEIRYEYSLGPKEQPLVRELTNTLKETNQTLKVARYGGVAVGAAGAAAVVGTGFLLYKGMEKLAQAWQGVLDPSGWFNKDKTTNPITNEPLNDGWKGQHYVLDWLFG